jgi:hypothetical protein
MAEGDKNQQQEVAPEARKNPRGQTKGDTPQPQMQQNSGKELALAGDTKAQVNPDLDTLSVSIPTGVNEEGVTEFDNFVKGKPYSVKAELLEVKNTENKPLLVAIDNEEGGE